jgi:hypothetical protein
VEALDEHEAAVRRGLDVLRVVQERVGGRAAVADRGFPDVVAEADPARHDGSRVPADEAAGVAVDRDEEASARQVADAARLVHALEDRRVDPAERRWPDERDVPDRVGDRLGDPHAVPGGLDVDRVEPGLDRVDLPEAGRQPLLVLDHVVVRVGDPEVVVVERVERRPAGVDDRLRLVETLRVVGDDDAVRADPADAAVAPVGHEDAVLAAPVESVDVVEGGLRRRAAVAAVLIRGVLAGSGDDAADPRARVRDPLRGRRRGEQQEQDDREPQHRAI